jgi:hypothetical protein
VSLRGSYTHYYRRMLAPLLVALRFKCNNTAFRPVMDAIGLLARYKDVSADQEHPQTAGTSPYGLPNRSRSRARVAQPHPTSGG